MPSNISKNIDDVVMRKTINQKAWTYGKLPFGDKEAYNPARARLKAGIEGGNTRHQQRENPTHTKKNMAGY